jgi:hypothetical protein
MKKVFLAFLFCISPVFASTEALEIFSQPITPRQIPQEGINIPMLKLSLHAKDDAVRIKSLTFQRTGLSSAEDVKSIRATGKEVRSRSFSMLHNDTAIIHFFNSFVIPANKTSDVNITANFDFQGLGRTVGLKLISIASSASHVNLEKTAQKKLPQTSSLPESNISLEIIPFTPSRLRLEKWQKIGRMSLLNNGKKDSALETLHMKQLGTGYLKNIFHHLVLTTSDKKTITKYVQGEDKTITFPFLKNTIVKAGDTILVDIWGKVRRNKSNYSVDLYAENEDLETT